MESSVFGAEFVVMKHTVSKQGLRYNKLRMMGVLISRPSCVYGDNMSVIYNNSRPKSNLKKKSNSICYQAACKAVVMK